MTIKNIKYLSQILPAVSLTMLAALGFHASTPLADVIDMTTAAAADGTIAAEQMAEKESQETGDYEDGTYEGTGTGYRGAVSVQVTVKEKQISEVDVTGYQDDEAYFNRAKQLIDSILTKQSWEVDSISGATYSSRGIKEAVENALTGAESTSKAGASDSSASGGAASTAGSTFTTPEGGYQDGTYTGSGTGFGGTIEVQVVISGGKITAIDVVSAAGETASYLEKAKGLLANILSRQSPNVDAVSGATYSSNGILSAVKEALTKAAVSGTGNTSDETAESTVPTVKSTKTPSEALSGSHNNGTFVGSAKGYDNKTVKVELKIQNNKMTSLKVTKADTADFIYKKKKQFVALLNRMIGKQSSEVDKVTGATVSSNAVKSAVRKALASAAIPSGTDDTEETSEYQDGRYLGSGVGFGGIIQVQTEIKDNKMTALKVTSAPDETPEYLEQAKAILATILAQQSTDIDAVSGATYSSNGIKDAVKDALAQAKAAAGENDGSGGGTDGESGNSGEDSNTGSGAGDTSEGGSVGGGTESSEPGDAAEGTDSGEKEEDGGEAVDQTKRNGTYTGSALCSPDEDEDFEAYTLYVQVTFVNGSATVISVPEDQAAMQTENKAFINMAANVIPEKLLASQRAEGIDAVSGATCSSAAILTAYQDACAQADTDCEVVGS